MTRRISFIAMATLALSTLLLPTSHAAEVRYVTVKAQGSVKVTPDAVRINATASHLAGTSKDALATTAKTSAALRSVLKNSKIDSKDIATTSVTTFPEYKYSNDGVTTLLGYRATQSFTITVKAAESAGTIVDALVAAGEDSVLINSVSPFVLNSNKAVDAARAFAFLTAIARAASAALLEFSTKGETPFICTLSPPAATSASTIVPADSAAFTVIVKDCVAR